MVLTISSDQFVFARSRALIVGKSRPEWTYAEVLCLENVISDVNIVAPGEYSLWLSEIEVRTSNGKSVRLNGLLRPWVVEFTQADLDRGSRIVPAPPGGVFRITVVDAQHTPIPHHKLIAWAGDETTIEIWMDENGMQVTYDNPTVCLILVEPGRGVLIERVDTATL